MKVFLFIICCIDRKHELLRLPASKTIQHSKHVKSLFLVALSLIFSFSILDIYSYLMLGYITPLPFTPHVSHQNYLRRFLSEFTLQNARFDAPPYTAISLRCLFKIVLRQDTRYKQ